MRIKIFGTGPIFDAAVAASRELGCEVVDEEPFDLCVLANVQRILKPAEFERARLGTLCFHPSMLPRHRGADAVYWTFAMGDRTTGVTWFWVDAGIDTGPIAIQREVEIPSELSRGAFYYGTLVPLGATLYHELLEALLRGEHPSTVQDEALATYEPKRPKETAPQ